MNSLGIYFSQLGINFVEVKGKKILSSVQIPSSAYAGAGVEDKVSEELKIVAIFKDELRKNKVTAKEANICLSATDLIIRTFEIPILPANEIANAVNFEAKKYLPFKLEELFFSYQILLDKVSRKNFVLFLGLKKDILEKYISIMKQLDMRIIGIEYSAFSLLRFIPLNKMSDKGLMGIISLDYKEELSADFTVIENGFPLFARDIRLPNLAQESAESGKDEFGMVVEKFKTELRISLDYYNRKFPAKKIEQLVLIDRSEFSEILENFAKELKITFKSIDPFKISGKADGYAFLKAYSASLFATAKSPIKTNIITSWERSKQIKELSQNPTEILSLFFSDFKLNPKILALAICIAGSGLLVGLMQKLPVEKEIQDITKLRPKVISVDPKLGVGELDSALIKNLSDIKVMDNVLKKQLYLTPKLSLIPTFIKPGTWLTKLSFETTEIGLNFYLEGLVYLQDSSKELEAVNQFFINLKNSPDFNKNFKNLMVDSVESKKIGDTVVTSFAIKGTN